MEQENKESTANKDTDKKDITFLIEQYRVLSNDRINHNGLFWNVPVMFLTAQSFLLVIALGGANSYPWERAIGAFISFVFGILSIQIFERNRINEITDAEMMLDIERHFISQGFTGSQVHQKASKLRYLNGDKVEKNLDLKGFFNFFNRGVSYSLWKNGMWLVTIISVILFFYNILQYFETNFPYFGSFHLFIGSLNKAAVGTILILVCINWIIYLLNIIRQSQNRKKRVNVGSQSRSKIGNAFESLKPFLPCYVYEFITISSFCFFSAIAYFNRIIIFRGYWLLMFGLCILPLALCVYYEYYNSGNVSLALDRERITVILAGGMSLRLQSFSSDIIKFIHVHIGNQKLLENTIYRNWKACTCQVIVTVQEFETRIRNLPEIDSLLNKKERIQNKNISTRTNQDQSKIPSQHPISISRADTRKLEVYAEPCSRGTATAIYFYLRIIDISNKNSANYDPVLIFAPSDHVISDTESYAQTILKASNLAKVFSNIYLLGIPTSGTSTLYGHIQVGNALDSVQKVECFLEKPDLDEIERLRKEGVVFWNSGIFIARYSVFLQAYSTCNWPSIAAFSQFEYETTRLSAIYEVVSDSPFEKEILEQLLTLKTNNVFMVKATFDWIDVGDPIRLQKAIGEELCSLVQE